jgi:putrescine transport system ATP-binding protein
VAVRPEKLRVTAEKPGQDNSVAATVLDIGYLGDLSIYRLNAGGVRAKATIVNTGAGAAPAIGSGDDVWLSFAAESAIVLTG